MTTAEASRLAQDRERIAYWKRWEAYLSDRQWGMVRWTGLVTWLIEQLE
ncbi:MAG TPA: hypothetical protein V6C64_05285 [Microcoleaceae cyanobacterium]|jgi:hypothetical protein